MSDLNRVLVLLNSIVYFSNDLVVFCRNFEETNLLIIRFLSVVNDLLRVRRGVLPKLRTIMVLELPKPHYQLAHIMDLEPPFSTKNKFFCHFWAQNEGSGLHGRVIMDGKF